MTRKSATNKSLSVHFSRCSKLLVCNILLTLLVVLSWSITQPIAETVIFTDIDDVHSLSKHTTRTLMQLTLPSLVSAYWYSEAYWSATFTCVACCIFPFVVILGLVFLWTKPQPPATRIRVVIILLLSAKIPFLGLIQLSSFSTSSYMDVKPSDDVELQTVSGPVTMFAVYVFGVVYGCIIMLQVFFEWDQMYCHLPTHEPSGAPGARLLEYKPRSCLGVCVHALFLTATVCTTWLLIESWYTVALRMELKGLLTAYMEPADTIKCLSLIQIPSAILDACFPTAVTKALVGGYFMGTIVASGGMQLGLLIIWFAPVCSTATLIRLLLTVQSVNLLVECAHAFFLCLVL